MCVPPGKGTRSAAPCCASSTEVIWVFSSTTIRSGENISRKAFAKRSYAKALKAAETMGHELESATSLATRLKTDLGRMQGQVDIARGKQVGATR